jgi:hypothetical protein
MSHFPFQELRSIAVTGAGRVDPSLFKVQV